MPQGAGMIWLAEHLEGRQARCVIGPECPAWWHHPSLPPLPSLINVESMLSVAFGECFLMRNPVCILGTCFQLPPRESSKLIGLANGLNGSCLLEETSKMCALGDGGRNRTLLPPLLPRFGGGGGGGGQAVAMRRDDDLDET